MKSAVPRLPPSHPDQATHNRRLAETVNNILGFQHDDSRIRTPAEVAAGVTPVNYAYAPGDVRRYGAAGDGTTDDSLAFSNAAATNPVVLLQANTTYLVSGVTLASAVTIQGGGQSTVILAKTTTLTHGTYSQNIFASTASIDYVIFQNLTLDGGCNGPSNALDTSEIPLVKITAAAHVIFDTVKLTRYCGAWSGVTKAISASFWEAIVIQNAVRTEFLHCLFTNNHYEMVLIWNAPGSGNTVLIDGCAEINTGTPDAHTAFDINGGHVTVTNCFWFNTGPDSQLNVQVAESVRVANCAFLSMQSGAAAQCNIGQFTFPFNSNVLIENNYFKGANAVAISVASGSGQIIRGNIIDNPGLEGILITAGVTDFTLFTVQYPEWPTPTAQGNNSIVIADNVINAVSNAGASKAIFLHTVNVNVGYWFKDVQIKGNTVTAGSAPNNTLFAIVVDDCQDLVVRDNWLQYSINGVLLETLVQNVRVEGNTFNGIPPSTNADILWNGGLTSSNVKIRNNQFNQLPVGINGSVQVFSGTVTGLDVIDNVGIHPTLPVMGASVALTNTAYVAYQTKQLRVTAAPAAGDWGINDVVKNVPTSAAPGEYICTVPGSFGSALTCTATGTTPNDFFACSAISQLHVAQHVSIAGAGVAGAALPCTVVYITGSTFYVDQVISTNVAAAAMSLIAPTFVKSANYT